MQISSATFLREENMVYCACIITLTLHKRERRTFSIMNDMIPVVINLSTTTRTEPGNPASDETFRLFVAGNLSIQGDTYTLRYQETQTDEDTRATMTQDITLVMKPGHVTMIREGAFSTSMVFCKDQPFEGAYHTPYGDLAMGIYASTVACSLAPDAGSVHLQYQLNLQGAFGSMNDLTLQYRRSERSTAC